LGTINEEIEELLYNNASNLQIAKAIKKTLNEYFSNLEDSFKKSSGKDFLFSHTRYIDSILQIIYKASVREAFGLFVPPKNSIPVALVALGSYGREQLCVYSDIDIMIVYEEIEGFNTQLIIEKILYILWDTGLKIGHRVHTVDELLEVSKTDITIKTALLESRFIEGSKYVWTSTQNSLNSIRNFEPKEYIAQKLIDREERYKNFELTMEPNIKDGVGGFRDANLVFWIGKILYNVDNIKQIPEDIVTDEEYKSFRVALEFLFRIRAALHIVTGKKEDTLRLELIPDIASLLDYKNTNREHVRLAQKVIGSLRTVHLYCDVWIQKMINKDSKNSDSLPNKLTIENILDILLKRETKEDFKKDYLLVNAMLNCKNKTFLSNNVIPKIKKIFYANHTSKIINVLFDAMILSNIVPPFRKIMNLPQFDGYHRYTVDKHLVRCLHYLENIKDKEIENIYNTLSDDEKAILKLATLLHDTGKGRNKDHSIVGALLFKSFAKKLLFSDELIKLGEILILNHTLMSKTAQSQDLYNEKTILSFVSKLKNKKIIDMLYILTYADMSGVENNIYNGFTAKLLQTLYLNSIQALENKELIDEVSKRTKKELHLQKNAEFMELDKTKQNKILQIPSNYMFLKYSPEIIMDISKMGFKTNDKYSYKISNDDYLCIEIIRVIPLNLGYLLGKLARLEIVNMDIFKIFDDLKYFKIEYNEKVTDDDLMIIKSIIADSFDPNKKADIQRPEILPKEIEFDCEHSQNYVSMYLHTKNQKGLLAFVLEIFDDLSIDVASAKILTAKNRARDMFLIEKDGKICNNIKLIRKKLTQG
jgi:[protein-PII] uridylyltransferase